METTPTPKDSLTAFRESIPNLICLSEAEQKEYIADRIKTLESEAVIPPGEELDHLRNPAHKGYIPKTVGIIRNMMMDPLYLDDEEVYSEYLQDISQRLKESEVTADEVSYATLGAVQTTIASYTGNAYGDGEVEGKNRAFYMDRSGVGSESISIKEFKHKGMAVCAEKAALAENILSFAGFDTVLIMSRESELVPGHKEAHAYNLLHTARGYFIYDPTNLHFDYDAGGNVKASRLAVYPISEGQCKGILEGGECVSVSFVESYAQPDGSEVKKEKVRIYGSARRMG